MIIKKLLDYIFPQKCVSCQEFTSGEMGFCVSCWNKINFIKEPYCSICAKELHSTYISENIECLDCIKGNVYFDSIKSLMSFDSSTKKIIYDLKFHDQYAISNILARMMVSRFYNEIKNIDLVIPVPMHKLKRVYRRYNHAQLLANSVSNILEKNLRSDILVKIRVTKSQTSLNKIRRISNLANSMKIQNKNLVNEKNILLVDDVVTTGATVNLCSRLLKKEGASSVIVLSAARKML